MSVSQLTAEELGLFSALCTHLELTTLPNAIELCKIVAVGNCHAWATRYGDNINPADPDEIEKVALRRLADADFAGSWGPIAYNVTFEAFSGSERIESAVRAAEEACRKFSERYEYRERRAEQDAASYDDAPPQPVVDLASVQETCLGAGCQRIIYAEHRVDESDSMTDYFGGRSTRRVVIGFGKGKRESFKQLRKAAGKFPATAHLGLGKDSWRVWVYHETPVENHYTPQTACQGFHSTEAEAEAWIQSEIAAGSQDGLRAKHHGYRLDCDSVENRETYSMGGGNYLGLGRYSGWVVRSTPADSSWLGEQIEWFQPSEEPEASKAKPQEKPRRQRTQIAELGCMAEDWV